jgi:EAL domain-containing protein (putative c-di-GMP-specific phosphodiesterase class I)
VLEQACTTAASFAALSPGFVVSVNLSAHQLDNHPLVDDVGAALRTSGLHPAALCLEVTETVLMDEAPAHLDTLRRLREIGLALAIDDFGTGYSSLLYLKRLPVTMLKIDGQFVRGLGHHDDDEAIVALTIQLARALNLATTAEGVETAGQRDRLTTLGCGYAQGYLLGRPGPAHDLRLHT